MNDVRREILRHLEKNSKANLEELAILLGTDEVSVANEIADMEKEGIICGYHTLIDWDKAGRGYVNALIEVRVTPQRESGFNHTAERIVNYPEVTAVYLISGSYDYL
ncbi:MAG: Lrp/AsnC family transcriptional regulator, partial [Eubacteriales bacterium]|nr:Lrp/AsnC family transcriptional regulator [Eubacteriales bacterium]